MEHMDDMTALLNPTVNSYKRLMPGVGAPPVCNTWGLYSHRPLVRVPAFTDGEEICIEVRSPDMTSNPYFVYSMLLSAGLDGIKKGLTPPAPYTGKICAESCPTGQRILPRDLKDAIERMTSGGFASQVIGEKQVEYYASAKLAEWSEYCRAIHNWEIERYL
jgi:glutamine synthetase